MNRAALESPDTHAKEHTGQTSLIFDVASLMVDKPLPPMIVGGFSVASVFYTFTPAAC